MATMKGHRVLTSLYLDPKVYEEVRRLSLETGMPQAVIYRSAIENFLATYHEAMAQGEKLSAVLAQTSAARARKARRPK